MAFPSQAPISRISQVRSTLTKKYKLSLEKLFTLSAIYINMLSMYSNTVDIDKCYYLKSVVFSCSKVHRWQ